MQYLDLLSKTTEWSFCSFPRQTIQYHSNPSLCPNHKCQRSWGWTVLWRPIRPSRTNTQKRCPFHHRGLECKSRKSRDSWSNRQVWSWSKNWSRAKAQFCQEKALVIANTLSQQHKRRLYIHMVITRWSKLKSGWLYALQPKMEKLYTVSKNKTESWRGSDHELFIEKFRLKWKKVGKTIRPFRYDLNQIPYEYTVEVMNIDPKD